MISVAYALLLISLAFGTVPEAWAAPVGTRSVHVKTMRRIPFEKEHMRRVHHSAVSIVQRDDVHVPVINSVPSTAPVAARNTPPSVKSASVAARHGGHQRNKQKSDTATLETKRSTRQHHAKNEARGGASAVPRALPRFQRDEADKRSVNMGNGKRKNDASNANVAREPKLVKRNPVAKMTQEKREPELKKPREPAPQPTPVRPIVMFRRALAFEDLD